MSPAFELRILTVIKQDELIYKGAFLVVATAVFYIVPFFALNVARTFKLLEGESAGLRHTHTTHTRGLQVHSQISLTLVQPFLTHTSSTSNHTFRFPLSKGNTLLPALQRFL